MVMIIAFVNLSLKLIVLAIFFKPIHEIPVDGGFFGNFIAIAVAKVAHFPDINSVFAFEGGGFEHSRETLDDSLKQLFLGRLILGNGDRFCFSLMSFQVCEGFSGKSFQLFDINIRTQFILLKVRFG